MSDALQCAVQKLRQSAKSLNTITDQIADVVQQVETFLNQTCSAGVVAYVTVDSEMNDAAITHYRAITYRRVGSRYRIAVAEGWDIDPEDERVTAWAECTRDVKLETAKKLPELILEIAKQIDDRVEEATKTSAAVSQVRSALFDEEGE